MPTRCQFTLNRAESRRGRRGFFMFTPAFALALLMHAQDARQPRFEVASVKPGAGAGFVAKPTRSPGRIRWTTQLIYLIGYAYQLDVSRVDGHGKLGGVYILDAKFDPAAGDDQVRLMIQALLAERFKLQCHQITTEKDGFALVTSKSGIKMKQAREGNDPPPLPEWSKNRSPAALEGYAFFNVPEPGIAAITGRNVSVGELAELLHRVTGTPVWDRTGLTEKYFFGFRYARDLSANSAVDAPSLAAALEENLGLKLQKGRGPDEMLIVDHVEAPSEN